MALLETDPLDLQLDPVTWDLVIDTDVHFISGINGVAQLIRIALQLIRGEWFLDLDAGVPYFARDGVDAGDALMGQKFDRAKAMNAFRDAILGVTGVLELVQLDVVFDSRTRTMTVTWIARTAFGDTPVDTLAIGAATT